VVLENIAERGMDRLKILYYNWTDFDDPEQRGGGVSVYQQNLVDAATRRGDEVWFISSGTSYAWLRSRPFIRDTSNQAAARKFELVNSPIMSPGHAAFGQDVTSCREMEELFSVFLHQHGPFDIVHFNNLEGIPASFFRVAREHSSRTKIVYSMHNYYAFCPQVNLWFQEKATCRDYRGGRKCVNCLVTKPPVRGLKWGYRVEYGLSRLGIRHQSSLGRGLRSFIVDGSRFIYRAIKAAVRAITGTASALPNFPARPSGEAVELTGPKTAREFASRRDQFVTALNTYVDHVLAVSERVEQIAANHGIDRARLATLYIGTKFANRVSALPRHGDLIQTRRPAQSHALRVLYPGYMRRDKGFYFYLDALSKMPERLANRLHLVFATKISDPFAYERVKCMSHRFDAVTFFNGYTHSQLPRILQDVDLGIVPVLWEDNLPQVAIECVASGVPILTSDRGGARELLNSPAMVFRAGSYADFFAKLGAILDNPQLLQTAMAGRSTLFTPEQHYDRLRSEIYRRTTVGADSDTVTADCAVTPHPLCEVSPR
jgi:glycosyltransferase involved in cell wall biosynthesis